MPYGYQVFSIIIERFKEKLLGVFVFVLGLIVGSFLNVVIFRVPNGESIVRPPSHCGNCGTRLRSIDLIPVVSYIILKGKCRYCKASISMRYPLVELFTGVLFYMGYIFLGLNWEILFYFIYVSLLISITMIDFDHQIIPDGLVIFGFIISIVENIVNVGLLGIDIRIMDNIFGLLAGGGIFLIIALVSKGGMGGGDIKLMALLGFIFGLESIIMIAMIAFIVGAIISIVLLITKIKTRKEPIPFGPACAFRAIASVGRFSMTTRTHTPLLSLSIATYLAGLSCLAQSLPPFLPASDD